MSPRETVVELMEMRRKVVREMPHVDCRPYVSSSNPAYKCTCYKCGLIAALIRAEMSIRVSLGMEPF